MVTSRIGSVTAPVEVSDEMRPGVASLPHGWGHSRKGMQMAVAEGTPGVSCNDVTDDALMEPVTGNAVLNGVPVEIAPVSREI